MCQDGGSHQLQRTEGEKNHVLGPSSAKLRVSSRQDLRFRVKASPYRENLRIFGSERARGYWDGVWRARTRWEILLFLPYWWLFWSYRWWSHAGASEAWVCTAPWSRRPPRLRDIIRGGRRRLSVGWVRARRPRVQLLVSRYRLKLRIKL